MHSPLAPRAEPAHPTNSRQLIQNRQVGVYSETPQFLNQSTVRATASACGVGVTGPKARWNFAQSTTYGAWNSYRTSPTSRMKGTNTPATRTMGAELVAIR